MQEQPAHLGGDVVAGHQPGGGGGERQEPVHREADHPPQRVLRHARFPRLGSERHFGDTEAEWRDASPVAHVGDAAMPAFLFVSIEKGNASLINLARIFDKSPTFLKAIAKRSGRGSQRTTRGSPT